MKRIIESPYHLNINESGNKSISITDERKSFAKFLNSIIAVVMWITVSSLFAQSGGWSSTSTTGSAGLHDYGNGVIELVDTSHVGCQAGAVHQTSSTYDPTSGTTFSQCYQVFFGCPGNDDVGSDTKGDGLAFSFWKNSATFNINNGLACGGGLGYMGSASDGKMVTIEFDTWNSQCLNNFDCTYGGGNSGDHDEIALQVNQDASDAGRVTSIDAGNLEDGLEHAVCITYNPSTHLLTVSLDGITRFSYTYDLGSYFGAGGLNQTWSSGKAGATNPATVSPNSSTSISANVGGPLCPATVVITSPSAGDIFTTCEGPVTIDASVIAPAGNTVSYVEFFVDGVSIGTSSTAPYSIMWNSPTVGSHSLTAVAHFSPSNTTTTSSATSVTVSDGVQKTTSAPTIDGTAESLWNSYTSYSLTKGYNSSPNLAANYKIMYDATNLYVLVDVTDNSLQNPFAADASNYWQNDAVELYIDIGNDKSTSYGSSDYQYALVWNKGSIIETKHGATAGVVTGQTTKAGNTGYTMEFKLPWSTLGGTPATGTHVGFDVSIDDNDGGTGRDHQLAWSDGTFGEWNNPSLFGTVKISACAPCPTSTSAGTTQNLCNLTSTTLNATAVTSPASGSWSFVSGPNSPVITTSSSANSTVTGMTAGAYVFRWTVSQTGCTSVSADVNVTITSPSTPIAGSNSTLCLGGTINLTASTVAGTTSYNWTGPNGFTSTSQNPTISNATSAMAGTYSVTATVSGCTSATSGTTSVTINPKPTSPTAGSNDPLCIGGTINLTATTVSGATGYSWTGPNGFTSTSQNPTISNATSAMQGTYSVIVTTSGSGCTSNAATTSVTINSIPTSPTAGSNGPLCIGGTINLTASAVSGATGYSWTGPNGFTSTSQNPTISNATSVMAGTYSVTVTTSGSGCTSNAATTSVTINSIPTSPTAGSNGPLCKGGTINLTASTVSGATGYSWSGPNGFTSASQNPTINNATSAMQGTYSLTVTTSGSGCTSDAATTSVTINSIPTSPTAGSNGPLCIGGAINLTANTVSGATGYSWTGPNGFTSTSQNPTISNATSVMAGTYSVTVTTSGSGCASNAATTSVTINSLPTSPTAGSNGPLCTGGTINLIASTVSGAIGYSWTGPNGFTSTSQNPTISNATSVMAGTYNVTVTTSGSGCTSNAATTSVTINSIPSSPSVGSNGPLCIGGTINLTASTVPGATGYSWTGPNGFTSALQNPTISNAISSMTGTYSVAVTTSGSGCTSGASTIDVTVNPNPTVSISPQSVTICPGSSTVLTATGANGTGSYHYAWSPSTGLSSTNTESTTASPSSDQTYTVVVTDDNACSSGAASITVSVAPNLQPLISGPSELCDGSVNIRYFVNNSSSSSSVFNWSPTGDVSIANTNGSEVFINIGSSGGTLTVQESTSTCNGQGNVTIAVNPNPSISVASSNVEMCSGVPATLDAMGTGGTGAYEYIWTPTTNVTPADGKGSSISVNPLSDQVYTVILKDAKGCSDPNGGAQVNVKVNSNPTLSVAASDVEMCAGVPATISASTTGGTGTMVFTWTPATDVTPSNGIGASITVNPSADQTYTVTVEDSKGCTDTDGGKQVNVKVNQNPTLAVTSSTVEMCEGTTVTLEASGSGGTSPYVFNWTPTDNITPANGIGTSVTVSPSSDKTYTVTLKDAKGCTDQLNPSMDVSVVVNSNPQPLSITGGPDAVCASTSSIEYSVSPYNNASSYDWKVPSGFTIISVNGATVTLSAGSSPVGGNITVTETTDKQCTSVTPGVKQISINSATPIPSIDGGDRSICSGPINIVGSDPGINGVSGTWSSVPAITFGDINDPTTTATDFATATVITWTLTGPCGSESTDINVHLNASSFNVDVNAVEDTLCVGSIADISASVSGSATAPFIYSWMSSDGSIDTIVGANSSISVNSLSTGWTYYTVSVIDANGCSSSPVGIDSLFAVGPQTLIIPNLITPNNDNHNDCLIIQDINGVNIIPGSVLELYNRWGQSVYRNEHYKNGDFCGSVLSDGIYYYYLKTSCGIRAEEKGWIEIISNTESSTK